MKKILKEFREFAVQGNMIDMAVGMIIGAAFKDLVNSLVSDMVMPVIGLFTGKLDFSNMFISLNGEHYATLAEAQNKNQYPCDTLSALYIRAGRQIVFSGR